MNNSIKTIVFTLALLMYLYFIISPKEPFKVFPSLMLITFLIASCVYYIFVKKSDHGFGKISTPLLSFFIGLFLALYVNGSYNYMKDSEVYKLLLINTQLEIDSNLSVLKQTGKALEDSIQKPINALTNSVINSTLQNPIFLRHASA